MVPGDVERDRPVAGGESVERRHVVDLLLGGARLTAQGNRPNLVPPVPTAHEGAATEKLESASISALGVTVEVRSRLVSRDPRSAPNAASYGAFSSAMRRVDHGMPPTVGMPQRRRCQPG